MLEREPYVKVKLVDADVPSWAVIDDAEICPPRTASADNIDVVG